jgi:hypothetical protein
MFFKWNWTALLVYYKPPAPGNGPAMFVYKKPHIMLKERTGSVFMEWKAENDEVIQEVFL